MCRLPSHNPGVWRMPVSVVRLLPHRGGLRLLQGPGSSLVPWPGTEKWPSGRRRRPAKALRGYTPPSRVRIPPSPLAVCARRRRGGRADECGGLENRYPSFGGSRVRIPPPPPLSESRFTSGFELGQRLAARALRCQALRQHSKLRLPVRQHMGGCFDRCRGRRCSDSRPKPEAEPSPPIGPCIRGLWPSCPPSGGGS